MNETTIEHGWGACLGFRETDRRYNGTISRSRMRALPDIESEVDTDTIMALSA